MTSKYIIELEEPATIEKRSFRKKVKINISEKNEKTTFTTTSQNGNKKKKTGIKNKYFQKQEEKKKGQDTVKIIKITKP